MLVATAADAPQDESPVAARVRRPRFLASELRLVFTRRRNLAMLAVLAVEGTRRAWGWALPIVAIASPDADGLDGYRVLAYLQDGNVRLESRRGLEVTQEYPEVSGGLARQPRLRCCSCRRW